MTDVLLGYEVGTGKPVSIPIRNTVVTGQTQESGKTTTLEALIHRSNVRALAFTTKRGEHAFSTVDSTPPYFRERADWEFVQAILEATMRERMKFERAWIVRATKGARDLAGVQRNVRALMGKAKGGMNADMYMLLDTYLDKVVPQIARTPFADALYLHPGLNVMDLTEFSTELQMLIIPACLEWIYERESDTVCVIPEAWEFLPTNRKSPVGMAAVELVRKGSVLKNYLWLDSQDIAGLSTEIRRSVIVWLLGVQREANEVKRALEHIPANTAKPKVADIMQLERGQFFACYGKHVHKVYVQPRLLTEEVAIRVATGQIPVETAMQLTSAATTVGAIRKARAAAGYYEKEEPTVKESEARALRDENATLKKENQELRTRLDQLDARVHRDYVAAAAAVTAPDRKAGTTPLRGRPLDDDGKIEFVGKGQPRAYSAEESFDNEQMYQAIKKRLIEEAPALIKILATVPEIEVSVTRKTLTYDESTLKGRLAKLLKDGFFSEPKKPGQVRYQLQRTGPDANTANIGRALDDFTKDGFVTNESNGYVEVPGMKVRITEAA